MTAPYNDPLFDSQWYLANNGQRGEPGVDINLLHAWIRYSGSGIVVAVNDDGMDLQHPDLSANILLDRVYDTANDTTGSGFAAAEGSHGTVVGSIIAMQANNGVGGVGVAHDAKLVPGLAIGALPEDGSSKLFLANLAAGVDVSCNSWGADPAFSENFGPTGPDADRAWGEALLRCVTEGRDGRGMVIEVSGGNERGNGADNGLSNFNSSRFVISVGAVDQTGKVTEYSTPGVALLVSAPGGVATGAADQNSGYGIISADVSGAAGYNTSAGDAGNYAYQNEGTSYSGPIVAGVAALMLQANPALGFRDVSAILAMTARKTDPDSASWLTNKATDWNLGGMHYSRDVGFGLVDAAAAVRLAEAWMGGTNDTRNWAVAQGAYGGEALALPDGTGASTTVSAQVADAVRIDRVEIDLQLAADAPSQLRAVLVSPQGTEVTLFDSPLTRALENGAPTGAETPWPGTFTIGATGFLGENSAGEWRLTVTDKVSGVAATLQSFAVRAWGNGNLADNQYLFTNEFSGQHTLTDSGGVDTINAAAMSVPVRIDLREGATSTLTGGTVTLAPGTVIENASGGAASDTITGNAAPNLLRGGPGLDFLDGEGGIDVAAYSGARASFTINRVGGQINVTDNGASSYEGADTLVNVERLWFSDTRLAFDDNAAITAKILGGVFGQAEVANKVYAGIGLSYLDAGTSYADLMQLALNVRLGAGFSVEDEVRLFYQNLVGHLGVTPTDGDIAYWVGQVTSGALTPATLGVLAADLGYNTDNINLIGLMQTGLEYA